MPMDRSRYPANWDEIALSIKDAANWHCEECKRPCKKPGEDWHEFKVRLSEEGPELLNILSVVPWRFVLTVFHTDHDPENPKARLRALCSACHCQYDLSRMPRKRQISLEKRGQLKLDLSK